MKKILVQKYNNKFFRNLDISPNSTTAVVSDYIDKNIYELYYKHNFDIAIVSVFSIDNSLLQFAIEYADKIKLYAYIKDIKELDTSKYEQFKNLITFIYSDGVTGNDIQGIKIPYLINDILFNDKKFQKTKYISCFIDSLSGLSQKMILSLYPNNKSLEYGIRMFNNPNIQHHQNLGTIDENDRSNILKESEFYLDIDGEYSVEASMVGCKILDEDGLSTLTEKEITIPQCQSYTEFLRTL